MKPETKINGTRQMIMCSAAGENYVLDMTQVVDIQRADYLQWNEAGETPDGWLRSSSTRVPVFALAGKLGLAYERGDYEHRIIVLQSTAGPWGLIVDHVSRVMHLDVSQVLPLPALLKRAGVCFSGMVRLDGRMLMLLSAAQLHAPDARVSARAEQQAGAASFLVQRAPVNEAPAVATRGRVLLFNLPHGDESGQSFTFGLSVTQVPEVLNPLPLMRVPGAPPFVAGLVEWRNRPLPVIDLAARMGLPPAPGCERTRLMICRADAGDTLIGFAINPGVRMLNLPVAHTRSDAQLPLDRSLCKAVLEIDKQTVIIPDAALICSGGGAFAAAS